MGNTTTVQDDGIDSVSWERINDEQIDQVAPSGSIELVPRANDLQSFLMCIAGDGAFATNQKLPGNICQYFQFGHADPYVDKVYRYNNCVTPSAVFSSSDSDPILRLAWNIEAQSRTVIDDVSANFPALTPSSQPPFVFRQGVLTVGGTAFKMK
ncbi:MAG: hypothetical protein NXI32_22920, partial [bacterium]|nr:hypothetical protein [bacterium]